MSTHAAALPIPIVLVAGFLGSGKTTLMRHLITAAHERGLRCAVIVNEFGEVDVDANILRQSFGAPTNGNETHFDTAAGTLFADDLVASLAGGCACCSGRDELHETLLELASRAATIAPAREEIVAPSVDAAKNEPLEAAVPGFVNANVSPVRPDVILMEASGLADPITLLEVVTAPDLLAVVRIAALVGVVDAARYGNLPHALAPLLLRQLQLADFLVINKADLVETHRLEEVETQLRGWNSKAQIEITSRAAIRAEVWKSVESQHSGRSPRHPARFASDGAAKDEEQHAHSHTLICALPHPVERARLEAALHALPDEVWRVKGFVRLRGESGWFLVQYTGASGGGRSQLAPFFLLAGTDEPTAALVFIGSTLDHEKLRRDFGSAALGALW
jgi:G3E family GTPase